jgi:hypothetical protein
MGIEGLFLYKFVEYNNSFYEKGNIKNINWRAIKFNPYYHEIAIGNEYSLNFLHIIKVDYDTISISLK